MNTYEQAQEYVKMGFSVIPLHAGSKRPLFPWTEYQTRRPVLDELTAWFKGKTHNIGIVTGKISGVTVVDLDSDAAVKFTEEHEFPATPTVTTGKGRHLYFKYKDGVRNFQKRDDLPNIDLRGDGGYVVAPPSVHESGKQYQWLQGHGLGDIPLAELPEIVFAKKPSHKTPVTELVEGVPEGKRNDSLARLAGRWAAKGLSVQEGLDLGKGWNQKNPVPLPDDEVRRTVESIFGKHTKEVSKPHEWQEPVLFDDIKLPVFPPKLLPDPVGNFAKEVARFTQTPLEMASFLALAVVSAAVAKKYVIQSWEQYIEPLNIWTLTVLESGNRKSAVLDICRGPLEDWEHAKNKEVAVLAKKIESETLSANEQIKALNKKIKPGSSEAERRAIEKQTCEIRQGITPPPPQVCLFSEDITPERLSSLMEANDGKIAIFTDECSIFDTMKGQYSQNNTANLDPFLKAHSGSSIKVHRATRPEVNIRSASLVIGITPQPVALEGLYNEVTDGRGLTSRFLYVLPKSLVGFREYRPHPIPHQVIDSYHKKITSLLEIKVPTDDEGNHHPVKLRLGEGADELLENYWKEVEIHLRPFGELDPIKKWGSKLPGAVARIAGLFHVIKHDVPGAVPIDESTMDAAIKVGKFLVPHAFEAFSLMGGRPGGDPKADAIRVWNWIKSHKLKKIDHQDLWQGLKGRFHKAEHLDTALNILIERNYVRELPNKEKPGPGRPKKAFEVNLALTNEWK